LAHDTFTSRARYYEVVLSSGEIGNLGFVVAIARVNCLCLRGLVVSTAAPSMWLPMPSRSVPGLFQSSSYHRCDRVSRPINCSAAHKTAEMSKRGYSRKAIRSNDSRLSCFYLDKSESITRWHQDRLKIHEDGSAFPHVAKMGRFSMWLNS
jgi:hypothetical protein